jgi:hypothetical protein
MLRSVSLAWLVVLALAAQSVAGKYTGKWTGSSAGGGFTMSLESAGDDWKAEVAFTIADNEVKTKVTALKIEGAKVEIKYEFDLGGNILESTIRGELSGDRIAGKYTTIAVQAKQQIDQGDFEATKGK